MKLSEMPLDEEVDALLRTTKVVYLHRAAIDFLTSSEEVIVNQCVAGQSRLVYSLIKESLIGRIQTGHFNLEEGIFAKERGVLFLPMINLMCGFLLGYSYNNSGGSDLSYLSESIKYFISFVDSKRELFSIAGIAFPSMSDYYNYEADLSEILYVLERHLETGEDLGTLKHNHINPF